MAMTGGGALIGSALHSNLVLFKFNFRTALNTYFGFTFQSGSIQMIIQLDILCDWMCFTFQSGSIQMLKRHLKNSDYIAFTFQSGSIQMG